MCRDSWVTSLLTKSQTWLSDWTELNWNGRKCKKDWIYIFGGFSGGSAVKNPLLMQQTWAGDLGSIPASGICPGEGNGNWLPGKSHGQRSLEGYHPWGCKRETTGWPKSSNITDPLCCTAETNMTMESNYTPIKINLKIHRIWQK